MEITEIETKFTQVGSEMVRALNQLRTYERELEDQEDAIYNLEKLNESHMKQAADDADKVCEVMYSTFRRDHCLSHRYLGCLSTQSQSESEHVSGAENGAERERGTG